MCNSAAQDGDSGHVNRETGVPRRWSIGAIGFGARRFAHKTGIADASPVFQSEVHPAIRVNRCAAFSTDIFEGFAHRLEPILLLNGGDALRFAMRLCGMVLGRHGRFGMREAVESGAAIVAAIYTDTKRTQKIFLDGAATVRTRDLHAAAKWAQPFGNRGNGCSGGGRG